MILSFPVFIRSRWLTATLLGSALMLAAAQENEPAGAVADPTAPDPKQPAEAAELAATVEPAEATEPTTPESDASRRAREIEERVTRALNEATNIVREIFDSGPRLRVSIEGAGPAVGVFNDVAVAEGDTVDQVVTVFGSFTLEGECRGEAVVVFGRGNISGPVGGECVTVFGDLNTTETIDGDLQIICSKAYINGHVKGDIVAVMSNVEFGPDAVVDGERRYIGPQPKSHPDAEFHGPIIPINIPGVPEWMVDYVREGLILGRPIVPGIAWCWYILGFLFVFRLVVALLFPAPVHAGTEILRARALRSFLIGVIAMVLFPFVLLLLVATGVGTIAVPFLLVAMLIAAMFGKIAVLRSIGGQLGRQMNLPALDSPVGGLVAGTALVALVYMVPVLGAIVFLLIKPMALGAMLIATVEGFRRERPTPSGRPPASGPVPGPSPVVAMASGPAATLHVTGPDTPRPTVGASTTSSPSGGVPPVLGASPVRPGDLPPEEMMAYSRVGFWPRLGATFLDLVLVGFLASLFRLFHLGPSVFIPLFIAYHVAMWAWRGTTLGGIVFRLRLIRLDGRPPDFTVSLVRALGGCLSFVVAGLGFFWASWNPEKQSWHDMIAGTVIVKTPRSLPLI